MKDYKNYKAEDFAGDENFQNWVINQVDADYWHQVLLDYPEKAETLELARELISAIDFRNDFPQEDVVERTLKSTLRKINSGSPRKVPQYSRWWVAAAIAFFLIAGIVVFLTIKPPRQAAQEKFAQSVPVDIEPGGDKAVLTLADGSKIILDSTGTGLVTNEGGAKIVKQENGRLAYEATGNEQNAVQYNTISTPAGGQFQIVLADGSKIWLNSKSSLRFPASFTGRERVVQLTGEGYFEVAQNKNKPFRVEILSGAAAGMDVEVLGTRFNVMAYNDENRAEATLLEGSVKIMHENSSIHISPGQQVVANPAGELEVKDNVDIEQSIAWKNGLFQFDQANIKTILRQLARWYDLEVVYEGAISDRKFFVIINRSSKLSEVLNTLQDNQIKFKLEGKKLIVEQG